jgi:phage/plasmid-associated DNA primase
VAYLREGLGDLPPAIEEATKAYRRESDQLADFLDDKCIIEADNKDCWIPMAPLYISYSMWCDQSGLRYKLTKPDFDERMEEMRFKTFRPRRGSDRSSERPRAWAGIRLRTTHDDSE